MKKIFILFSAIALLNSCERNEDLVASNESNTIENLKYKLPNGKDILVSFVKETGEPIENKDFELFKDFVEKNKEYATFIDKEGLMNLVKNKEELAKEMREEVAEHSNKGVIILNCSGSAQLLSDTGSVIQSYQTTNQTKLLYAQNLSNSTPLIRIVGSSTGGTMSSGLFSQSYQGNISQDLSITQTNSIRITNCYVDIIFKDEYVKANSFPRTTITDYYRNSTGTNYTQVVAPVFYVNNKFVRFSQGNLLQFGYTGLCYTTT